MITRCIFVTDTIRQKKNPAKERKRWSFVLISSIHEMTRGDSNAAVREALQQLLLPRSQPRSWLPVQDTPLDAMVSVCAAFNSGD